MARRLTWLVFTMLACVPLLQAADDPETLRVLEKYQSVVDRGLQWLAKQQARDGHWEALNAQYPVPMTALAGLAMLAEGSTPHQGKYAKSVDLATDYLLSRVQKNGLIGRPDDVREQQRYMYGHGYGTLFLALVYGEENDDKRRKEIEQVLRRAVEFTAKAQTRLGGWGYVSALDNPDFDEGSVTITQVQALRACKNAGIPVPKETIDKAQEYLKKSTVPYSNDENPAKAQAGVIYSLRQGGGNIRPPLTAAAVACLFNAGEYKNELALKWLNYCQHAIPIDNRGQDSFGHWEYTHFYYAQVLYTLGEDGHAKLRPDLPPDKLLKWSKYREVTFAYIASRQESDGKWSQGYVGPVYTTALHLIILQLDKGNLPIVSR